jgi:DNA-binding MarR family transcriptional regulator
MSSEIAINVIASLVAAALLGAIAAIWRARRRSSLTMEERRVLETLYKEDFIRRASKIAVELNLDVVKVETILEKLKQKGLVAIRAKKTGTFWTLTLKGKRYLEQKEAPW